MSLRAGRSNSLDEGIVQKWLLDNPDMRLFGAIDYGRTRVAGDENRRCLDPSFPQFCDQVEAGYSRQILIDDESAAVRSAAQRYASTANPSTSSENLSELRTAVSSSTTITTV